MALKTFGWKPERENMSQKTAFEVRKVQFGGGYSQRQPKFLRNARRTWEVSFVDKKDEIDKIAAFLDAAGGVEAFLFQPLASDKAAAVTAAEYRREPLGGAVWKLSATFEEVFG
ncbi:phage tail protein [Neisseria elongata]|uniref:phage tail protein n=1 Tax=Neisseria elongata TaxID=495 RepID=UPI002852DD05|nr:phage tail protein [Neisseria elongata]